MTDIVSTITNGAMGDGDVEMNEAVMAPVLSAAATATDVLPSPARAAAAPAAPLAAAAASPAAAAASATAIAPAAPAPEEFVVEKILQMRMRGTKKEYLIKWKGYGPEENSWEPEENCDCPAIVEAFERERRQSRDASTKRKADATKKRASLQQVIDFNDAGQPRGFDRGLQPDRILGATDSLGELMFLMKWRDSDEADLVPARQANVKCPQIVIAFYEERLSWYNDEDEAAAK